MNCEIAKENFLSSIRNDFVNGSMTIVQNAIEGLIRLLKICPFEDDEEFSELLKELRKTKPTMQALKNAVEIINREKKRIRANSYEKVLYDILQDLQRSKEWTISRAMRFFLANYKQKNLSIVTTSYSSTVNKVFENLANLRRIKLRVVESKWKEFDYSRQTFQKAMSLGINCEIVGIENLRVFAREIDFALSGADCICFNEGIVNGTPTKVMAEFCREYKIPYFVIAESIKFAKECPVDDGFDFVPSELISGIFTDGIFFSEDHL